MYVWDDAYRFSVYIHCAGVTPAIEILTIELAEIKECYFNADLWELFLVKQIN